MAARTQRNARDTMGEIANTARARRNALGLSQEALAQKAGVSLPTIKNFEAGKGVSVATLLAVAEAMNALAGFSVLFRQPLSSRSRKPAKTEG